MTTSGGEFVVTGYHHFDGENVVCPLLFKAGGVEFVMREAFTGMMAPLIAKSIPDMQPAFDEFAAALKRRCEQGT